MALAVARRRFGFGRGGTGSFFAVAVDPAAGSAVCPAVCPFPIVEIDDQVVVSRALAGADEAPFSVGVPATRAGATCSDRQKLLKEQGDISNSWTPAGFDTGGILPLPNR